VHTLKLEGHEAAYRRLGVFIEQPRRSVLKAWGAAGQRRLRRKPTSGGGAAGERGARRTSGSAAGRCGKSSPAVGDGGGGGGPANCGGDGGQTLSLSQSPGEERGSRSRGADNV
jgi:hypothetical protein